MKFRWTINELENQKSPVYKNDLEVLRGLITERTSELNPYCPLSKRLNLIYKKINERISKGKRSI
jgi:hypothetical protein